MKPGKVYINGRLIGFHNDPEKLAEELVKKRRSGLIDPQVNVAFHAMTKEIYINSDAGRVQRPLIVVEKGKSKITNDVIKQVVEKKLLWNDLVAKGFIEFLDSEEEENALISLTEEELTAKHSHLEIDGSGLLSVVVSMTPYLSHNLATRSLHGAKSAKQAIGIPASNYNFRTDTESYLLYYPEKEIVRTQTMDLLETNKRPMIQNLVMAVLPLQGFSQQDAIILNRGSIDRALARHTYFRTYQAEENRYPGGQTDKFVIPDEEVTGFLGEGAYKHLGEDGLVELETKVEDRSVLIGRTSPPRFLEEINEFGVLKEKRRESSVTPRKGKPGKIDKVIVTESSDGIKLAKIKVRTEMIPEEGDKFASKHGQKGVVGAILPEEDMPFTVTGLKPDIILNPHAIPSRMALGHLMEMLAGKAGALKAKEIDGTPFNEVPEEELGVMLKERGFRSDGEEVFYDGTNGERIEGTIFSGVIAYRRLNKLVSHNVQARSRGPVQILTRQPTEGKEKEGGLRFGEMEAETLVGHGSAMLLQEKFIEDSDKTIELVCEKCGMIAVNDQIRHKRYCTICKNSNVYPVEMSYSFKLLLDELKALGIYPKINIGDKV
ncbi:MAG: DNA-directed RNA polymerase subunit B [archaeon]